MAKVLSSSDLSDLPEMDQNILFNYMYDLTGRRESLLGIALIFVYLSMAVLLYLVWKTPPQYSHYSSVTEMIWPFASAVFTLAVVYLVWLRKPWNYSYHNKRVLSARHWFLQNFDMDISELKPNDIWQGVVVTRANKEPYVTFPVNADPSKAKNN